MWVVPALGHAAAEVVAAPEQSTLCAARHITVAKLLHLFGQQLHVRFRFLASFFYEHHVLVHPLYALLTTLLSRGLLFRSSLASRGASFTTAAGGACRDVSSKPQAFFARVCTVASRSVVSLTLRDRVYLQGFVRVLLSYMNVAEVKCNRSQNIRLQNLRCLIRDPIYGSRTLRVEPHIGHPRRGTRLPGAP